MLYNSSLRAVSFAALINWTVVHFCVVGLTVTVLCFPMWVPGVE